MSDLLAGYTLWQRELVRFLRQPSRLGSAIATPLLFWAFLGSGLSASFRAPGAPPGLDYLEYLFPGTVVLLVLFASIFSTISVIEDRTEGFLQGVLVAPVARGVVVAGKVLGGATLAWLQGTLVLAVAPLAGIPLTWRTALAATGVLALLSLALTGLGFVFAWRVESVQGFHAVMNLLLMPLWLLSGALFPLGGAPGWLEWVMRLNPLTYGVAALRLALYPDPTAAGGSLPPLGVSLAILGAAAAAAFIAGLATVGRGRR